MSSFWYSKMGELDTYHFGDANSFFVYKPHEKFIPVFPSFYTITAIEGSSFTPSLTGGEVWSFVPPQSGRRISELALYLYLPKLAPTGINRVGGDVVCYQNDIAHNLFERIELVDGAEVHETIVPLTEHVIEKQFKKRSETKEDRTLVGWYDTEDDLNDVAVAAQEILWTVPFHFSGTSLDRALRIDELLNHDLRFRFNWRPWTDLVYNGSLPALHGGSQLSLLPSTADAGSAATITYIKLYATYYPTAQLEKVFYRKNAIFRTLTYQVKSPYAISSSTTTHNIPLTNFSYPVAGLLFRIRDSSAADSCNKLWTNSDTVTDYGLTVDGQKRYELMPLIFWRHLHEKMWPSLAEEIGWYYLPLSPAPMLLPDIVASSLNFTQCNDVTLDLTLSAGVTGYVDIWALTPNFFQYVITGDKCTLKTFFK